MCHDLKPIADRSKVMCYDQKHLKFGLFVSFLDLKPILNRLQVAECGSKGLKIGKKVVCRDLKPIVDRSEVMNYDFEPVTDRVEVMNHHFEAVTDMLERMMKTFVLLTIKVLSRLGIYDASLPPGRACVVRKTPMRKRHVPLQNKSFV